MILAIGIIIIVLVIICLISLIVCKSYHDKSQIYLEQAKELKFQASKIKVDKSKEQEELDREYERLLNNVHLLHQEEDGIREKIENTRAVLNKEQLALNNSINEIQNEMDRASANYSDVLDKHYSQLEAQYYSQIDKINTQKSIVQKELDKMRATQEALIEARRREKEVKEKQSFYCLPLSQEDASDIQVLETIKPRLNKPRVLSMLIWSTFFQKPMTALCNNVLGTKGTVCGIYKITNQETDEVYIGQAVDVATRWKTHAKCGLDIDRPLGNKLYQAMREYGIQNFSWELLETCSRDELDEKEKYYIELYNSYNYGYNSNAGNNKK